MGTKDLEIKDDADMDKEPETDPCPAVGPVLPRLDDGEDDLEKRLAWLAKEVRATSAEHAKKKRATSILEAREYKTAVVPTSTRIPTDLGLPKVEIAPGLAPQLENTIERRRTDNEWEVDVAEPEELSRTLPLDPHAPVPDPLPFHAPAHTKRRRARGSWVFACTLLGGIGAGIILQHSMTHVAEKSAFGAIPRAQRVGELFLTQAERVNTNWAERMAHRINAADGSNAGAVDVAEDLTSHTEPAPAPSSPRVIDVKPLPPPSAIAPPRSVSLPATAPSQSVPYRNPGF